jgi:hypothetical protein
VTLENLSFVVLYRKAFRLKFIFLASKRDSFDLNGMFDCWFDSIIEGVYLVSKELTEIICWVLEEVMTEGK